jgi:DNA-binding response OmpR family regulator
VLEHSGVRVDGSRRIAERDGHPVRLTVKEFGVLEVLLTAGGGWVTADELLAAVWDEPLDRTRGVVKIVVHTLRRKLGAPGVIQSAPGYGYRMGAS